MGAGLVWVFVVVIPLVIIGVAALFHLITRRPDLKAASKAGWVATIFLIPFVGVLVYAMFRPPALASGTGRPEHDADGSTMRRLRKLIADRDSDAIDDDEYAAAKAELFGL